jgi:tRNA modification GTPase
MCKTNRAILLTPQGSAAIAVVRLVGPAVGGFLREHFSRRAVGGRCVHGDVRDGGRLIDDAVVVLSPEGDLADVNLHGGPWVVRSMLDLAGRSGFQTIEALAAPLPDDAVDAATALEREVLAYLPLARTELALRVLLGESEAWQSVRRWDRSEGELKQLLGAILADRSLFWLLHPPRVAIVGAPNAGKSALANQLFAQERSITADLPGTTRDWVGEMANLDGLAVMLVDTPGQRRTEDAIERQAIERSEEQILRADLVVLVLDAAAALEPEQMPLLELHPRALRVVNKTDRPAAWDAAAVGGVRTVATRGDGIDALRREIRRRFGCDAIDLDRPRWWTDRQRKIIQRAIDGPSAIAEL